MTHNILLMTDSYKVSHYKQYPPKCNKIYSYFESRGGQFDNVCFFGLQYFLKQYLSGKVITQEKIEQAATIFSQHFGNGNLFNRSAWEYILQKYDGQLPLRIKAVAEGSIVPISNVLMTIENLDPKCYWLTNYLETLLVQVWYPSTVATLSYHIRQMMHQFCKATGGLEGLDFKLHDFGFRGVSSVESAGMGGAAHLINFKGTDTLQALAFIQKYYNTSEVVGFSVAASEHSTMTSWGKTNETKAYQNMLEQYPQGIVSVVSDSYDIYHACEHIWGEQLKEQVLARDGQLVIRPDSGDPLEVILKLLDILGDKFGYTTNAQGYKVLHPKVRILQGDGVDYHAIQNILQAMQENQWSADNIVFGMGGGLLQKLNRDTQKFAFKCSYAEIDGQGRNVFKDPITDKGKQSKKGQLKLSRNNAQYQTVSLSTPGEDHLQTVFELGKLQKEWTFEEVRQNVL